MKQVFFLLPIFCIIITACNSNKDKITVKDDKGGKATIDVSSTGKAASELQDRSEQLQKLTPLSLDELKAMLPEEIMGAKRDNMEATKMTGASFSKADYNLNDSTKIELNIFDCAGTAGAAYYSMAYFGLMSFEQDNEEEYTKTTDFNDSRAIENCKKKRSQCEFTYFGKDRYLVQLKGENVGIDQLKQIAGGLNLK